MIIFFIQKKARKNKKTLANKKKLIYTRLVKGEKMTAKRILFIASEMTPFVKTGGLGDVVGALPKSLISKGIDVKVIIPLYSMIDYQKYHLEKVMDGNCVSMGNCCEFFSVHHSKYVKGVDTYFIEFNKYFDRNGVYDDMWTRSAFQDNGYRYAFFDRAALQTAKDLGFQPDIVHLHWMM